LRYEIREIRPSHKVISTLEKQMEAERNRRAEVTLAEAERISVQNIARGERQEQINLSEGERQKTKNVAEGRAQAIEILANASAQSIQMVAEAIQRPGGDRAVKMQLVEQFTDELGTILEQANVSVVPADVAQLKTFFEGVSKVSAPVQVPTLKLGRS
jgi:regulator of protease activity HflC (stomatin/prohibitin superfamily)